MASIDVHRFLAQYVAEHRGGGAADPAAYLNQVHGADRAELTVLIDSYLARAPRRSFDAGEYRGSPAEAMVEALDTSLRGQAGLWPALLPRLRSDAQIKRSDLVERLADALGASAQREKVGHYYHQMEQGLLAPHGVSDRVLSALARIVHVTANALRQAGEAITPAPPRAAAHAVFARATPAPSQAVVAAAAPSEQAWDDIDRLFLGGR